MGRRYWCAFFGLALLAPALSARAATRLVQSGENLQTVLDAAVPGDIILLQAGATFCGNFVLPVKSGASFIIIRTSAPDSDLPGINERVTPAAAPHLARLVSPNSMPALRTAAGAHHWRLQFLEFGANRKGYGEIIAIGDGGSRQYDLSQVPFSIVLDRLYIHGDPLLGQKRGVALNGRDVTIRGSYISDIKATGQDSQAIAGWNGPGPYVIENNYLEAAAENLLFGGAVPYIPGVIADGVTLRGNTVSRPVGWKEPIVPTPAGLSATGQVDGGMLPAGTYAYRVIARRPAGQTNVARSTASAEVVATVPAGAVQGSVVVRWDAVPDAEEYYVYGRTIGAESMYWRVSDASFVDTGGTGVAGGVPASAGTRWTVKNLLELKAARNVEVTHNTFENNWAGAQPGYAIVLTPRGQGGACPWCVVEDVTFESNIVAHTAAAINILGYDDGAPTLQTRNIVFRNNLFYDINKTTWGGNGYFLLLGDEPRDIVVDHNTIVHNGSTLVYAYGGSSTSVRPILGFQFTNNAARHNSYGIWSQYFTYGTQALANYYPDAIVNGNLLASGNSSRYPAGNFFYSDFTGQFVSPASDDYRLADTSPLLNAGADGEDVGADLNALYGAADAPILADSFDDNVLDTSKWVAGAVFSGSTDLSVAVREQNSRLEIGPLKTSGWGYNGVRTAPLGFTGTSVSVQVSRPADQASTAYTMLTIGPDSRNHYRIWLSNGTLALERKINGAKGTLRRLAYDPSAHQYWRIRHDAVAGTVSFETATALSTGPGNWTVLYAEPWNAALKLDALMFELKAGTSDAQTVPPGSAAFDNFRIANR
jgi:hypothetical protein